MLKAQQRGTVPFAQRPAVDADTRQWLMSVFELDIGRFEALLAIELPQRRI